MRTRACARGIFSVFTQQSVQVLACEPNSPHSPIARHSVKDAVHAAQVCFADVQHALIARQRSISCGLQLLSG